MLTADHTGDPVTVHVTHKIKPGCEERFYEWMHGIDQVARRFGGFEGSMVFPPSHAEAAGYHVVLRFSSVAALQAFWESDEYRRWRNDLEALIKEPSDYRYSNGLEHWCQKAVALAPSRPPTYKMAVVAFSAILPLLLTLPPLLRGTFGAMPSWAAQIVITAVMVVIMSYVAMPLMTRVYSKWLYLPAHGTRSSRMAEPRQGT